jgi:monovalent cation:H+ antiporter-2, CPA2 family
VESSLNIILLSEVLFLTLATGLLFQYFRLPTLIGYVIAGVVIGPGILHLAGATEPVSALAELGIIVLMFMLGLELDLSKFRSTLKSAMGLAVGLLVLSIGAVFSLSFFFNWPASSIIIFSCMAAISSTAVAVSFLRSMNALQSKEGGLAVGILIAQDILVVPMLLVVGSLDSGLNVRSFFELGIALGAVALTLFAIFELATHPQWVRRLEKFFSTGISQPALAGIVFCFGAAALSGTAGLSTAFGAFAAGLLIGNVGTVGEHYRAAIEPIHDMLIMIFFISIGLVLDVSFAMTHWLEILVLVIVVSILKILGTTLLLALGGYPTPQALRLGAILGHIGEFAFVIAALGLADGMLSMDQYQLALTVIASSLILSPLWTRLICGARSLAPVRA